MKVAQDQEGNKAKLYNEIVVKEVPRLRTIRAKLCSERSPKTNNNKHEIIQWS